jgi:hypothetical protein
MLTDTGGIKVTVAEADAVEEAWLVALIVTVCCDAMLAGALYKPELLMVPLPDVIDQFTAVLLVLETLAENCCVWPP